jgi:hypothetical protein
MSETTPWELDVIDRWSDGRYYPHLLRLVNGKRESKRLSGYVVKSDAVEAATEFVATQERQSDE